MELPDSAQDYADEYRELVRQHDQASRKAFPKSGKKEFGRWAFRQYGDLVGEDPLTFFENMTESVGYKFAKEIDVEDVDFAFAVLIRYVEYPRRGRAGLIKAIRTEVLLKGCR